MEKTSSCLTRFMRSAGVYALWIVEAGSMADLFGKLAQQPAPMLW